MPRLVTKMTEIMAEQRYFPLEMALRDILIRSELRRGLITGVRFSGLGKFLQERKRITIRNNNR